ncbi:hypothetical protein QBC46DRAFT_320148 [Diplogelasinospora grovesii]|uniref:Autophagy protein n=1 Tax=Diplogelasinospora grovesii TaxID=303347 RepID=A0AAN6S294_9PEZI|nr:hypothetical protein QBC46DRAFT_320148 [Diplogelasinospora grovesii]
MGWFDGWFGSSSSSSDTDPLRKLDPKLREFLEKESPVKYSQQQQQAAQEQQQQTHRQQLQLQQQEQQTQQQQQQQSQTDASVVPRESLFQDGRYAHLWKSYRPLAAVEAETKNDHEKLMDVLEGFKERKAEIGRAALENCAEEQLDWNNCMKSGDWTSRMTMCRTEVKKFERCYMTQSRLLKALGYLQSYDRPPEVDEDIQMRADTIYHRMLQQEEEIAKAKAEGRPIPSFPPLITTNTTKTQQSATSPMPTKSTTDTSSGAAAIPQPDQATLDAWKEKLEKLPEEERAAEEQALRAEHLVKAEMAAKILALRQEQAREREARKAEGKATIGDKITSLLGN